MKNNDPYTRLLQIATAMITNNNCMSPNPDDYPKHIPNWVSRGIEKDNARMKALGVEIAEIRRKLLKENFPTEEEYKQKIEHIQGTGSDGPADLPF